MLTDKDLLARADAAAFTVLFERHCNRVLTHCARRLNSREDGLDAMSAVFLEAWLKIDKIRYVEGTALPWLLVVGTNVTANMLRSRLRQQRRLRAEPLQDQPPDFTEQVADGVDAARLIGHVHQEIVAMPKRDQVLISLCDLGGLSHSEAAAVLGIPLGTVKSRLSRAHQKLRISIAAQQQSAILPRSPASDSKHERQGQDR